MALKSTTTTAGWIVFAAATVTGLGVIAHHFNAGQGVGPGGGSPTVQVPKDDRSAAERMVAQLGKDNFQERETADRTLRAIGGKAYPAVGAGHRSKVAEIAQSC